MKKKHHITIPIFCLLVAFSSCTKDKNTETKNVTELQKAGRNIGEAHNKALNFFLNNEIRKNYQSKSITGKVMNLGEDVPQVVPTATELITYGSAYFNSLPENSGSILPLDLRGVPKLDSCLTNFKTTNIRAIWDQSLSPTSLNTIVTPREQAMLAELTEIFDGIYTGAATGINNSVGYQLTALETKYQNIVFEPNEGELFTGALNIAKSSNEYWSTTASNIFYYQQAGANFQKNNLLNIQSNPSAKGGHPFVDLWAYNTQVPLVQVDAVFFIVGWLIAVGDDIDNNNLHPEGQWRRLRKGLEYGASASLGGGMRVSQTNNIPFVPLSSMPIPVINY